MQLAELNIKLAEQKVVLAEKSSACEILLQEIATNTTVGQCSQHSIRLSSKCNPFHIPYSLFSALLMTRAHTVMHYIGNLVPFGKSLKTRSLYPYRVNHSPQGSTRKHNSPSCVAEEKKKLAEDKAKEIEEQNKVIAVEKRDAESSLAEALPALEAARIALQSLDKSDVTEIRCPSLPSPLCAPLHPPGWFCVPQVKQRCVTNGTLFTI